MVTLLSLALTISVLPQRLTALTQSAATSYLKSQPLDDWTVMGLASANALAGVNLDFLKADPGPVPTDIEKRILAVIAAGQSAPGGPETFGSVNLISKLADNFTGTEINSTLASGLLNDDIFGLLALSASQQRPEIRAQLASFIKQNQNSDQGFSHYLSPAQSNSDITSMAIMALLANGEPTNSQVIQNAFNFLISSKTPTGYSHYAVSGEPDPYSTAWVITALRAAGKTIPAEASNYLNSFERSNGSLADSRLLTAYGLVAASGSYPVKGVGSGGQTQITSSVKIIGPVGQIFQGQINLFDPAAINTVSSAAAILGFTYEIKNTALGQYVQSIAGFGPNGDHGWLYAVNGTKPGVSAANYILQNNDRVIWFYGGPNDPIPSDLPNSPLYLTANILSPSPPVPCIHSARCCLIMNVDVRAVHSWWIGQGPINNKKETKKAVP